MKKRTCTAIAAARAYVGADARGRRLRRIAVEFTALPADCPLGELLLARLCTLPLTRAEKIKLALAEAKRVHEWEPTKPVSCEGT